ncbi:EVE domain-containing protein [Hydrogenophaga sp.]|uniref:EVE domain-containing protein n=1 Tax=Hydrogenophaga sp. TaxID=1904254 RepID=UPI00260A6679|nr:EVE domain-containing protein [Hydrogenophaga sp.]MCW5655923.1 EVE domain-containing protein [Hydrogenophaga sp.]
MKRAYRAGSGATPPHPTPPRRNWIAVACQEHALRGCAQPEHGFMQVCHGKQAPLQRLNAGDRVVYYAPTRTRGGQDKLQAFVSAGLVLPGPAYSFDMGGGFVPYRRDVAYVPVQPAPIAPLLDALDFVEDRQHWGYRFRFGLLEVGDADMRRILRAMQAPLERLHFQQPAA